ncbi:Lrp/AsnC family transcriptional regulator [Alphaproteobacteria bacterium KMM 3653]|uniref:Lrp/AsnC family transcriptional regulator n=1 Tax=Harenicola maris TaxID=2841044 RepID=A0AAP2G8I2_9RHOB|nr:Lrp/AsnC family transcriptional regulator [Harenicola maris]
MEPIDTTDRQLLTLLRRDGRASVTALAAELGLSRVTVKQRMARMQASGVIRRFTVETTDAQDEGIKAISMLEVAGTKLEPIKRALARMPEVTDLHSTNGNWGLVAQTRSASLSDFDSLLNRIGRIDGVVSVETCLLLSRIV